LTSGRDEGDDDGRRTVSGRVPLREMTKQGIRRTFSDVRRRRRVADQVRKRLDLTAKKRRLPEGTKDAEDEKHDYRSQDDKSDDAHHETHLRLNLDRLPQAGQSSLAR
jgi:hypothetical protein